MLQHQVNTNADTLGLDSDGDDVDLIRAVEGSFGVFFGDETAKWFTVGDIYDALLPRVPSATTAGLCSTSMAFYRIRAALLRLTGSSVRVRPNTRLADLAPYPPKRLFSMLSQELGVRQPRLKLSWRGGLGVVALLLGVVSAVITIVIHPLWPLVTLIPAGLLFIKSDEGSYGAMTVGDLARHIAVQNFACFATMGADTRQATLWRALCELLAEETDADPAGLTPGTRLLA